MPEDWQEQKPGDAGKAGGGSAPDATRGADIDANEAAGAISDRRLDAAAIVAYLERHPEFFVDRPDLLGGMTPPSRDFSGGAGGGSGNTEIIDLQHYMLRQSQAKSAELEDQLSDIVGLAREGMHGQARIHSAVLAVVGARGLDHLIEVATTDIAVILDLDISVLAIEEGKVPRLTADGVQVLPDGMIAELMGDADVILAENIVGDKRLFGSGADLVRSQALIRLAVAEAGPPAILGMGVRRAQEFSPSQGTDLMSFLGQALTLCLRNWLDLPPD